jgi:uncharacterized protein (DUF486 family)
MFWSLLQQHPIWTTVILLTLSNVFMTIAWYGHLRIHQMLLWQIVLISWGIAFFEYCLQVPANRIGHTALSAAQLKVIQEVISLSVFAVFSVWVLREPFKWNYALGFVLILAAVFVVFRKW